MRNEPSIIRIKNLRLRTYIGFNPEEQEKKQDVVLNVVIHYDSQAAASRDAVDAALDYKSITKRIIHYVEENRFFLLERLSKDVLEIVMQPSRVLRASVEIDKPHALRFADSVSLIQTASRQSNPKDQYSIDHLLTATA